MSKRFELINFLNAHDDFKDNKNNKKLDSFDVVVLLNHYDKLQTLLVEKDQRIAELEEQMKNAIVPKFKFDEECVVIMFGSYHFHRFIAQVKDDLCLTQPYNDIEAYYYVKPEMVFKTLEEAKAKLKELQGE